MTESRERVCALTSEHLSAAAGKLHDLRATIGLDGFVDEILAVVDKRLSPSEFEPVGSLAQLGAKITAAAGQSSNLELVVRRIKLGGNGPIMANALAAIGISVNYIGNLGLPHPHPVFADLVRRTSATSIGEPGHTDALEFSDGKLMLGKHATLGDVTWERIVEYVGRERFLGLCGASDLVGLLNWTMLPAMSRIWSEMLAAGAFAERRPGQRLFIDLCDPEKRTLADLREALALLAKFQQRVDVVLGLNFRESEAIATVLGGPIEHQQDMPAVERRAQSIQQQTGLSMVLIHPRSGAAAATASESAAFMGPYVGTPKISTGGGDHFNAGFATGLMLGMPLAQCLCIGVATSGMYVRTAESPTAVELVEFIRRLPGPTPDAVVD